MIRFLLKGLLRDRSRSLFPIIIVTIGVALTVLLHAWMQGAMGEIARSSANFSTGHVKIMSRAYAENQSQSPNDLALLGAQELMDGLKEQHPDMDWVARIRFGGLVDVPDENGETRSQGPATGLAVDLLSPGSTELAALNIKESIVRGNLPGKAGEILVSDEFATKLKVKPGDQVTLMSSTMYGSMSMANFSIAGTVRFGINAMDKGAVLIDITDIRQALDMNDASGEILGYFKDGIYHREMAIQLKEKFNPKFADSKDEYAPTMVTLADQDGLGEYLVFGDYVAFIASGIFVFAMSIVLWNVGLIGGLRRYGEMGLRIALGEDKSHVYGSLIVESVIIGGIGSIAGTIIGLGFSYYMQIHGIDIGSMAKNSSMMMANVMRAEVTTTSYYIGFFPGLLSTVFGAILSGIGVLQRQTAQLFKELDA